MDDKIEDMKDEGVHIYTKGGDMGTENGDMDTKGGDMDTKGDDMDTKGGDMDTKGDDNTVNEASAAGSSQSNQFISSDVTSRAERMAKMIKQTEALLGMDSSLNQPEVAEEGIYTS
ncbi:uncharacterized protein LOC144438456 [Glandiceps talaboti]